MLVCTPEQHSHQKATVASSHGRAFRFEDVRSGGLKVRGAMGLTTDSRPDFGELAHVHMEVWGLWSLLKGLQRCGEGLGLGLGCCREQGGLRMAASG